VPPLSLLSQASATVRSGFPLALKPDYQSQSGLLVFRRVYPRAASRVKVSNPKEVQRIRHYDMKLAQRQSQKSMPLVFTTRLDHKCTTYHVCFISHFRIKYQVVHSGRVCIVQSLFVCLDYVSFFTAFSCRVDVRIPSFCPISNQRLVGSVDLFPCEHVKTSPAGDRATGENRGTCRNRVHPNNSTPERLAEATAASSHVLPPDAQCHWSISQAQSRQRCKKR